MTTLLDLLFQNRTLFYDVVSKEFFGKPYQEINLAEEVVKFMKRHPKLNYKDLVNPFKYRGIEQRIHHELGINWSYGGWLENRSAIFQHTYLKKTGSWIHLGIDINLPIGTPIHAALGGTVHIVDSDYPEEGGWGNFVIIEHQINGVKFYSIYGHLSRKCLIDVDLTVSGGEVIGLVGNQEENGFWFPHTHFQFISETEMKARENPFTLDGYGKPKDLAYLRQHYPDPLVCLPMADK